MCGRVSGLPDITWWTWVKRSTSAQSSSVTTPTGRPSSTTNAARWERLGSRAMASPTVWCGSRVIGVSKTRCRCLTQPTTSLTTASGMSCGSTVMPPRRAMVSAIRRPATAVMLATTMRDRRTRAVAGGQVDVVPGGDVGAARHHEHVVVGEVVAGRGLAQELHGTGILQAEQVGPTEQHRGLPRARRAVVRVGAGVQERSYDVGLVLEHGAGQRALAVVVDPVDVGSSGRPAPRRPGRARGRRPASAGCSRRRRSG